MTSRTLRNPIIPLTETVKCKKQLKSVTVCKYSQIYRIEKRLRENPSKKRCPQQATVADGWKGVYITIYNSAFVTTIRTIKPQFQPQKLHMKRMVNPCLTCSPKNYVLYIITNIARGHARCTCRWLLCCCWFFALMACNKVADIV